MSKPSEFAISKSRSIPASLPAKVDMDLSVIARFLRRYAWTILAVFVATAISGYAALSLYTEQYDISTELLVKIGRENLDPPAISRNMPLSTGLRREELLSEIEILKSPALLHQLVHKMGVEVFRVQRTPPTGVIARFKYEVKALVRAVKDGYQDFLFALDLKKNLPEMERVIQDLSERLSVEPRKDSDVISVKLRHPYPQLGVRVLDELVGLYLVRRIEVRRNAGVKEYLDERVHALRGDLDAADQEKVIWKQHKALISSPAEEKAVMLRLMQDLSLEIGQISREIETLNRQIAAAREQALTTPAFERTSEQVTPNPLVQSLRERIALLEADRVQVLARFQVGSVAVRNVDDQLNRLRELLAKEKTTQPGTVISNINPIRQSLEQKLRLDTVRLAGLQASQGEQQKQMTKLKARLTMLDEAEAVATTIDRKRQIADEDYRSVLKRRSEAEVAEQLDQNRVSNVSLLSPPMSTLVPVYPPKLLAMAVILGAGLLLGFGLSLLLHYSDQRATTTVEDVEDAIRIPLLGEVKSTAGQLEQ